MDAKKRAEAVQCYRSRLVFAAITAPTEEARHRMGDWLEGFLEMAMHSGDEALMADLAKASEEVLALKTALLERAAAKKRGEHLH